MPADKTWLKRSRSDFPLGENRGTIHAGPGTLFIDVRAGESGRGALLERIDLRGSTAFAVTEHARIAIRQSSGKSRWPEVLPDMRAFLDAAGDQGIEASHGYAG
ncbi:hypothetical protein [Tahibacter harae]|uniref:Uncharacterized protein n=1 Tax=Tahibacter harae TaxID=2963937 RepID=A0ABT1QNR0_9GAMM|nr:hypothetical protein [Tahibacter harae]MCQ4163142.1 hypothetical protein [Tahibacter harae]